MIHDPVQVVRDLKAGNQRFRDGISFQSTRSSLRKLKELSTQEQSPRAVILCCSDSRAPVEMIFDQDIGDLFVIRVAGNIIAPSLIGSVEFAAATFGTNVVLVMGHSHCGAVKATVDHVLHGNAISTENIQDIVSRIKPHIYTITQIPGLSHEEMVTRAVVANVLASVNQLTISSRLIEGMVQQGKIKILGAVLDLATGNVEFLDTRA
jgi:carbonic anhydrase